MTVFNLPDLGEGLPDAEVVKWLVAEGDAIQEGENMVEMSTAKAVVEVPSPYTGRVVKLHGGPGDLINTGSPLVTFAVNGEAVEAEAEPAPTTETVPEPEQEAKPAPDVPVAPDTGAEEIFLLPDLGEGLPDAEIVQWLVAEGEAVTEGVNMVEMSTAKAVVEVPAPFTGVVARFYGGPGDVIETGKPLIAILTDGSAPKKAAAKAETEKAGDSGDDDGDAGAVVGELIVGSEVKSDISVSADGIKASPVVRATAKKLKINLAGIAGSGADGQITVKDVRAAAGAGAGMAEAPATTEAAPSKPTPASGDVKVGPAARNLARELGVDLAGVTPSGPRGAICKKDIIAAAKALIAGGAQGAAVSSAAVPVSSVSSKGVRAAPKVRAHARAKGVDLSRVAASGPENSVTIADVNAALRADFSAGAPAAPAAPTAYERPQRAYEVSGEAEKLVGPRRVMANMMAKAAAEICHTPIFDEADISRWPQGTDITVRIMRAVVAAAMVEPAINAWYDHEGPAKTIHGHVSLGMAVDSPRGLFVPVIKNLDSLGPAEMRSQLDRHRKAIGDATITAKDMSGATITLSNFGMMAGKFAAPIISMPEVAIVGIGGLYDKLVMMDKAIENHRFMPVSLTFDHRAATGGEAARFLRGLLDDLELAS